MVTIAELLADNNKNNQDKRKHRDNMTKAEVEYLRKRVNEIANFEYMRYSQKRLEQITWRGFNAHHVRETIYHGEIVEAHVVGNDPRVLLRWTPPKSNKSICVVVSLKKRLVVTIYLNPKYDKHSTLNWSAYTWRGNIRKEFDSLLQV